MNPIQWQCGECGQWVDGCWGIHTHQKTEETTLDAMIALRRMNEMLPGSANDPLAQTVISQTRYFRTGKEPTREMPL